MLISWIVLAIGQLSVGELPLMDVAMNPSRPMMPAVTPGEPSTLVEALIGTTLVAAYLLFARRMRRPGVTTTSAPGRASELRKAA